MGRSTPIPVAAGAGEPSGLSRDAIAAVNPSTLGERWYPAPAATFATLASTIGRLYTIPLVPPRRGGVLDAIGYRVTSVGATSVGRAGIYSNLSDTDPFPDELLAGTGEFSNATSGVKSEAIAVELDPDELYWLACLFGVQNLTVQAIAGGAYHPIYGSASSLTSGVTGHHVNQGYGPLPSSYPSAGLTFNPNAHPLVMVRFAA